MRGKKLKHGHGKMTKLGFTRNERTFGQEEYEGDWEYDKMHGYGRYEYPTGSVYTG